METYIIVWGMLPLLLLLITIWSSFKLKVLKGEREPSGMYLKQFLFSLVTLVVSIVILYSELIIGLNEKLLFNFFEVSFLEWLIYPVVLVIFAKVGEAKL